MIELKILTNLYKEKQIGDEIVEVLYKKDIVSRKCIDPEQIVSVQEAISDVGKVYKNKCIIYVQGEGHLVVKHKYDEIKKLKDDGERRTIGY